MTRKKSMSQILEKRAHKEEKGFGARIFRLFLYTMILLFICGGLTATGYYYYLQENLPKISSLKDYYPPLVTVVYSDDGKKIAEFFKERRILVPFSETPEMLVDAFVAAEDARFY
ncbi:MAG: penicillin-binding protein, partial [Deltaproteobacteria bacterium]